MGAAPTKPMALLKTQPDVRLLIHGPLAAGALAKFEVLLDCPKPLPVDAVSMTLIGEVVWYTTSEYGRHRNASAFLNLDIPLVSDKTELDAGTHQLMTRVSLSEELPGSWRGDRLAIEYGVKVHVDIPWWPDKRVSFVVEVTGAPKPPEPDGQPTVFVSDLAGPPARGPYLEISLGQGSVTPGSKMQLSAALGNVDQVRYRKLNVALIAQESYPNGLGGSYTNDLTAGRWNVDIGHHPGELQPIPFSLALPSTMAPPFALHGCELRWMVQVQADAAWTNNPKLRVPLEVSPLATRDEGQRSAPLAVGSERLRLIWSNVARTCDLEHAEGRLRGVIEGVALDIQREQIEGKTMVVGLLEFEALGVDLQVQQQRRGLLGGQAATLDCREPAQLAAIQAALGKSPNEDTFMLLDASDTRLRFANESTGLEHEPLLAFAQALTSLAPTLARLPEELPPPAALAEHAEAWRAAAKALRAELRPGDLQPTVTRGESTLRIRSEIDSEGQLRATELELDPGQRIPSRYHLFWSGDNALPESDLGLDALASPPTWLDPPRLGFDINGDRIRVSLPGLLPDPQLERDRIEALFGLGRTLRGEHSPYR